MSLKRLLPRYDTSRFTKAERPMAPIWTPLRRPPAKTTRGSCRQTSITTRRTFSVSDSRGRRGIGPLCPGSDNRLWSRQPDESWDVDCRLCRHLKGTRLPLRFPGTEKTYGILYQITSAEILAKATTWESRQAAEIGRLMP